MERLDHRGFPRHGGQITTGPLAGSKLLVLTTTGARTGTPQATPLGYTTDGDRYVVVGSNSGRSQHPAWLRNIKADPNVTVEVGETSFPARAAIAEGEERRRLLDAHIAAIPIFAKYEEMAGRELPVIALTRIEERSPSPAPKPA